MTAGNGKPCVRCGTCEWDSRGNCRECARIRAAKWREENPEWSTRIKGDWKKRNRELLNERARKQRLVNGHKLREQARKWREKNRQRDREYKSRWRRNNLDQHNETNRKWRRENPEKAKAAVKRWRENNPDRAIATVHKRLAKKKANGGSFTANEWRALCKQYGNRCAVPGCDKTDIEADHVIPIALGGSSNIDNIQPLCRHHNSSKGIKTTDYRIKPGIKRWIQKKLFG